MFAITVLIVLPGSTFEPTPPELPDNFQGRGRWERVAMRPQGRTNGFPELEVYTWELIAEMTQ